MAYKIQIQYDDMQSIASQFDNFSETVQQHLQQIESLKGQLEGGGWEGVGRQKFSDEMDSDVLPKLRILQMGYEAGGAQIRRMIQMFEEAEQVILSYFASL